MQTHPNLDANEYLGEWLKGKNWKGHRAVLFLDPFGLQVSWETIRAIARTEAIDLWYLFPFGIGINRLLKKDGNIDPKWRERLDDVFGETAWYERFYAPSPQMSLFGNDPITNKSANFDTIQKYIVERLRTEFEFVADNPLRLVNSRNNPLYLLCFASANATGLKIAQDVLKP